jgi:hypothetical protein
MILTEKQIEILKKIHIAKQRGDSSLIAKATGHSLNYVSMVLNPKSRFFNQNVVDAAVKIITEREKRNTSHLKNLDEQITANATQLQTY